MTRDEAQAVAKKYVSQAAAARACGIPRSTFNDILNGRSDGGGRRAKKPEVAEPKQTGRTLADFRQTYDKDTIIPARIRAGLKQLGSGWEYESAFAKLAGVSLTDMGNYRDGFADYVVLLRDNRRAWAGTITTAKAMREML